MTKYKTRQNLPASRSKARTPKAKAAPKGISPKSIFFCAVGVGLAGGIAFYLYEQRKNAQDTDVQTDTKAQADTKKNSYNIFSSNTLNDSFPLKRGSKGARVTQLQQALSTVIGMAAMKGFTAIDGAFGKGTESALKAAGYGKTVNETLFNKITMSVPVIVFNPMELAKQLYQAASIVNSDKVLSLLSQIKDTNQYSSVNTYYQKQGFVRKTIVTHLLNQQFTSDPEVHQQIQAAFNRMGLKQDPESGKWSLYGLGAITFRDIITVADTYVIDQQQNRIKVARNTILGDEQQVKNGLTVFRAIDNTLAMVPSQDVKYV